MDADVRLTSRRGTDLTEAVPEVVDALASHLSGVVVDGELVVWGGDRLGLRRAAAT